jgi:tetratricopeptide (TPR) repeat protein
MSHRHRLYPRQRLAPLLLVGLASFTLLSTLGCHRDPNVRKQKYLESGERYEKSGKHKEALIQYSNALKIDHNFAAAHFDLATTYLAMGNALAAYQELLRTVDLAPSNAKARLQLGQIELAGGLPDKALEQAKALIALDPQNADAYALMAAVDRKKGHVEQATTEMQHALELAPNRADFHTQMALLQNGTEQGATNAEQELRRSIAIDPKNVRAHLFLGLLLEKQHNVQGAIEQDQIAIQLAPADVQARGELVNLYLRQGDKASAERTLRDAADRNPDSAPAVGMLKDYYFQFHQPDAAESAYADLYAKHPQSLPIKIEYANILATRQHYDQLRPIVAELVKAEPNDPEVATLNAALLLKDGKLNDAFDLLQKTVKSSPDNARLRISLAKVAALKGDDALTASSYREAAKLQPRNLEAQTGLAEIAGKTHNITQLSEIANKTLQMYPEYAPAYLWRATAEVDQKENDKAEEDLNNVLKRDPNNAAAMTVLAEIRMHQGKNAEAATLLDKVLTISPQSLPALHLMETNYLIMKQPEKAIERTKQQIEKLPKDVALYDQLAALQFALHDAASARTTAQTAIGMNPADETAVQIYSEAASALGDPDSAIAAWKKWGSTHPNNPQVSSMLALFEDQKGDKTQAMAYYRESLKEEPGQPLAQNNLAYLMVETGQDLDEALQLAQAARRSRPDLAETADTLAWVYFHQQHYPTARDLLEDALKIDPNNASMQYHLGMTYSKLGKKADAATHLKKAESLAPDKPVAKEAAAELAKLG